MRGCIHRGSQEIGGNCVELESRGQRIVLDMGLPLGMTPGEATVPAVPGLATPDPSLLGVIISHPHLDHYGLAPRLPSGTPLLIGRAARRIIEAAGVFIPSGMDFSKAGELENGRPVHLGPFTITPYLVDHSAFDAYALLVEADGQRLFYSGDLRGHGRKGRLFDRLVANPPRNVDVLMLEGSTLGRAGLDTEYPTEMALEQTLIGEFGAAGGLVLACASGQNIDRLVTLYRAALQSGRQFVVDMYTASVLLAVGNAKLPQPGHAKFRVYLPEGQKRTIKRQRRFDIPEAFRSCRIYDKELRAKATRTVMLFRYSMAAELETMGIVSGAKLIWSLWQGYLAEDRQRPLLDWLDRHHIPMVYRHTSGHASERDLRRLIAAMAPRRLVPIHSACPERFADLYGPVQLFEDGQWWPAAGEDESHDP